MRPLRLALALLVLAPASAAQPALRDADRVRLAEAFRLADAVADGIWPGWGDVPFAILLVTPDHEYLVGHPSPSDDFAPVTAYDSLLAGPVVGRPRQFPPGLLATFPAVGGIPTVVVGTPETTGLSSTFWVLTLLHEHLHQLQMSQPGYYAQVAALDLAGGDESGMWMLTYPFPYDDAGVVARVGAYRDALVAALAGARGPDEASRLSDLRASRTALRAALSPADDRYLSFQMGQEGVARFTEHRVAEAAAARHDPLSVFVALPDAIPYAAAADTLRHALAREIAGLDLAADQRVAFYPLGAVEALVLDAVRPAWRRGYLAAPFDLSRALPP